MGNADFPGRPLNISEEKKSIFVFTTIFNYKVFISDYKRNIDIVNFIDKMTQKRKISVLRFSMAIICACGHLFKVYALKSLAPCVPQDNTVFVFGRSQ